MKSFHSQLISFDVIKTQEILTLWSKHNKTIFNPYVQMFAIHVNVNDLQRMDVDKVSLEGKDRVTAILENGRCQRRDPIFFICVIFTIMCH